MKKCAVLKQVKGSTKESFNKITKGFCIVLASKDKQTG